jgi:hypothetical protein
MSEETNPLVKSDDANALADIAALSAGALQTYDEKAFGQVSKNADYLCRMQLCGSNSNLVKKNKIAKGNYAYVITSEDFKDLGSSVDILPVCWRPKALDMSGDTPVSFFDPNSAAFKAVAERSGQTNSNCTFGPEYLVWIPSIKMFATLHWGSKTSRKDAKNIHALLQKPATMTHRIVENDKGQIWETFVISACSTPFEIPGKEEAMASITKFMNEAAQKAPEVATNNTTRQR